MLTAAGGPIMERDHSGSALTADTYSQTEKDKDRAVTARRIRMRQRIGFPFP